jgi:antitoxin CptB
LLELDLVLEKFVENRLQLLTEEELDSFEKLLLLPDNDILDLAMGRAEINDPALGKIVDWLRV